MDMELFIPRIVESDYALDPALGGTDSMSVNSASTKAGWVRRSALGVSGGVANLGSTAKLPVACVPGGEDGIHAVTIGPVATAYGFSPTVFTITNYDSFTTYEASTTTGAVSVNGDKVTYTPNIATGVGGFTVNGTFFQVQIMQGKIAKPSIIAPVNNSVDFGSWVFIASSKFAMDGGSDTQESMQWQVSTDPTFSTTEADVVINTPDAFTWEFHPLLSSTQYHVRVRYKGVAFGYSEWSSTLNFTTRRSLSIPTSELGKIISMDSVSYDNFGASVSISGDKNTVVIGANNRVGPSGETAAGAAYVFIKSNGNWVQESILLPSDVTANAQFGMLVVISPDGSTILVGSPFKASSAGAAYIFTRVGGVWTQAQKLLPTDVAANDQFGRFAALSSDGSTIIVSSYRKQTLQGAAYAFKKTSGTWTQEAKLVASDATNASTFGSGVAITANGDVALISANTKNSGRGAAYFFKRTDGVWAQTQKVESISPVQSERFGNAVALSADGNHALVTIVGTATSSGGVDAYVNNNGVMALAGRFAPKFDSTPGINFGYAISMSSDGLIAAVGAISYETNKGAVYVFARNNLYWEQVAKLTASDNATTTSFGRSVSLSADGSSALVGGYGDSTNVGATYLFG